MDAFRERWSEMRSNPHTEKPGDPPQDQLEPTQLKFTAEAAVALLQSLGLEKEDLEELVLYPEEQMTPAMLAQILRKIRAEKDQRAKSDFHPESSSSPSRDIFKPCEDLTRRTSGFSDEGSSLKAQSSSVKTRKLLQKSKRILSSGTSAANAAEKPKLKTKQSHKSKVSKSAPLKKKPADRKMVQTDGKNGSGKSNKIRSLAAAKPVKTARKLKQKDQEKCPSVSGPPTKPTVVYAAPSHSSRHSPIEVPRSLPTLAMIQDYAAETPRVFPHSCCLCSKDSADMTDWFFHQTSSLHFQSCKLLRKQFPEWDGEVRSILRHTSYSHQPRSSSRCQEKRRCRQGSWDSRSRSPSWSPLHPRDLSSTRSRSRSPPLHRGGKAQQDRRSCRSPGLRRRHDSRERREGSWSLAWSQSPSGSPRHRSSSADRGNSSRRGDKMLQAPPPSRRSCERRSSTETPLSSAKKVAKRLLKNSAVQVLSRQSDVQTAVRTLAPVLLAELAKMASPSLPSEAETLELAKKVAKKLSKEKPVLKKSKKVTAVPVKTAASKKLLSNISVEKKKALRKKVVVKVKAVGSKQTRAKNPKGTKKIQKKPGEPVKEPVKEPVSACCISDADAKATLLKKASSSLTSLTVGERLEENLTLKYFCCFDLLGLMKEDSSKETKQLLKIKQMFITNLPKYHDGCYSQEELAEVLRPFGFELGENNIYVIPQAQIAVVQMADSADLQRALGASADGVFFKESRLCFGALSTKINMQPFGFYKNLMRKMSFKVMDDGASTIFVQNISPHEVGEIRNALRKIGSIKNFLPLLNKVFIEFESIQDADRLGVWFSLLKRGFSCKVYRMKTPMSSSTALPPRLPAKALPNSRDIVNGATILVTKRDIPEGSTSPFWVPMTTSPYLFPTASAWFIIPSYITVKGTADIQAAGPKGSKFCTVMLTGLPEGSYMLTDITKRVSPYFPKDGDSFSSSKVVVLPLQRRAFIFFNNWNMCCTFAEDCIRSPVMVMGCHVNVHFVLEDMHLHSSEVVMYRNLMKWSNGHVPRPECLEKRLLLVEIFQTSVMLIEMVVNAVASVAPFVGFLPLANTIFIEMAEPRGVEEVMNSPSLRSLFTTKVWMKIRYIRPINVKVLSENLQDLHLPTTNCQQEKGAHSTCKPLQIGPSVDSKTAATQSLEQVSTDSASDSSFPHRPPAGLLSTSELTVQMEQTEAETSGRHGNQGSREESRSPGPESRNQIPVETRGILADLDNGGTKPGEEDRKPETPTKKTSEAEMVEEEEDAHQKYDLLNDQPPASETLSVECGHVTVETLPEEDPLKTSEEMPPKQQQETGAKDSAPRKDTGGLKGDVSTSSGSDRREEVRDKKHSLIETAENVPDEGASEEPTEKPKEEPIKEEDPSGERSPGFRRVNVESPDQSEDCVEKASENPSRSQRAGPEERHAAGDQPEVRGHPQTLEEKKEETQRFEVHLAASEDAKGNEEDDLNISRSTKRKLEDDAEETLKPDKVEGTPEDFQEPAATGPRGQPRKKIRAANVRKSPRGKGESPGKTSAHPESSTPEEVQPEIQKSAKDAGVWPLEGTKDEETVTVFRKQTRSLVHLDENQASPQSVRVTTRSKLQPFNPNGSYGQEFTVPTKAFYCNLCSVFYMRESAEEDLHCCSRLHYDKLREYCQKKAQLRKCSRKSK